MISTQPLYLEIKEDIKRQIDGGKLSVGQKIPSLSAITEQYGVSSITAVRVLKELGKDNYARHERGKGYFVSSREERKKRGKLHGVLGCILRPYRPITPHDNYFNEINTGIQTRAMLLKYDSFYPSAAYALDSRRLPPQAYAALKRGILHMADSVDGFILDENIQDEMVREVQQALPHPLVMVRRTCAVNGVVSVPAAYGPGAARAMELAIRGEYRQFILCISNMELPWLKEAMDVVRKTLTEQGVAKENIVDGVDFFTQPPDKIVEQLFPHVQERRKRGKTLVIGNSDSNSRFVCDHLLEHGLTAGEDYGLIGFGGLGYANMKTPNIATVDTRPIRIGELAVENLLHILGRDTESRCEQDPGFDIVMGDTF